MNLATFGVRIDPTPAEAGARRTVQAVNSIRPALAAVTAAERAVGAEATKMQGPIRDATGKFVRMGADGGAAGTRISAGMKSAADSTKRAGEAARGASSSFEGMASKIAGLVSGLASAYAAFRLVSAGIDFLKSSMDRAGEMENFKNSWAFLTGSFAAAKDKMAELAKFAQQTPFDLPGVNKAALALVTLKNTGLETMEGLKKVGDAAGKANQPIEEVANRLVRLIGNLQRGGGGGDEVRMLGEWRILSSAAVGNIMEMGQEAENFPALLKQITGELDKAKGSTLLMSTSWTGMVNTLNEAWEAMKAALGEPIITALKPLIGDLTGLVEDMTKQVTAMAPEIQALVSKIPAAFRVLRTDGGLRLTLEAAWESFSDLMSRTWKATGVVVPALLKRAAFEFIAEIDKLNQAGFFDGMIKALKEGIMSLPKDIAKAAVNSVPAAGNWVIDNVIPDSFKPGSVIKPDGTTKAGPSQGAPIYDTDLPTESKPYVPSPFLEGGPPPIPDFSDAMGEATIGPAQEEYGKRFLTAIDDITNWMKGVNEKADQLVADGQPDATLFPKAEIERNDDTVKDALLPGSDDIAAKEAEEYTKRMIEQNQTAQEVHDNAVQNANALRDTNHLNQEQYQREVTKSKETFVAAQESMAQKAQAAAEKQMTGVQKLMASWGDLAKRIDEASVSILNAVSDNISSGIVGMIDGTKSAKEAFADMAKGIVQSIVQIVIKLAVQYALMSAMGMAGSFSTMAVSAISGSIKHAGGEVGADGPTRSVPSSAFAGAQRYHTGGSIGSNEVPIIAEKGETVLTKDDANDIRARLGEKAPEKETKGITIMNVQDPNAIRAYLAANPDTVLNVLAQNGPSVQRILKAGGKT